MQKKKNNSKKNKSNRKLYEYLKSNPALLIATISFTIAGITAFLKITEYYKLKRYLYDWGFDISNINATSLNNYNSALFYFVLLIVMMLTESFVVIKSRNSRFLIEIIIYYIFTIKRFKKYIRKLRANTDTKKIIEDLKKNIQNLKNSIKDLRSILVDANIACVLISLLIFGFVIYVSLRINMVVINIKLLVLIPLLLIYVLFPYILDYIILYISKIKEYTKTKTAYQFLDKSGEILENTNFDIVLESPLKHIFDDEGIYRLFFYILYSIVVTFVVYGLSFNVQYNNKDYKITNINSKQYIIVYQSSDNTYYLDKIKKFGDKVIVDKNEQMILNSECIEYEINNIKDVEFK